MFSTLKQNSLNQDMPMVHLKEFLHLRINIFSNSYVEGDEWHYRFYAPHDAAGLIQLFGG